MSHTIGQNQHDQQSSKLSQAERESKPEAEKTEPNIVLSDADYEFLFNQLLEGIAHGWHERRITKFFQQLGDRGKEEDWIAWLERIGPKLFKLPVQSQHQLGMLMTRLGELTRSTVEIGQIGAVSYLWGRKLLLGDRPTAVWEYVGPDLALPHPSPAVESSEPAPADSQTIEETAVDTAGEQTEIEDLEAPTEQVVEPLAPFPTPPDSKTISDSVDFERENHHHEESKFSDLEQEDLQTHPTEVKQPETSPTSEPPLAATEREPREIAPRRELSSTDSTESLWDDDPEAIDMQQVMHLIQEDRDLARQISQKLNPSPSLQNTTASSNEESHLELIESWFNLGLKQVSAGELEQAIASWEKALNINPNLSEAWHNRGSALGRLGNYEAAIDSFQNALSINPNNYQAWNERAHALYQLHNWTEAVASWSNALKIMPGNYLFWYNRGCALEQLEKWSEAIASYEKALEIKPDFQPGRSRYINLVADNSRSN